MAEFRFKKAGEDDDGDFNPGFKIPNPKLGDITSALRQAHEEEEAEETKKNGGKPKKRERKKGVICCCGSPGCSIGPMQEKEEEADVR